MADEYQLSYTGQQIDEAIGKALTGLPTITIALSQVIGENQVQLTNEQFALLQGRSVIFDGSALGMPVVVANYNGMYEDNDIEYLEFIFTYNSATSYFVVFNKILVNPSTKVAEIFFDSPQGVETAHHAAEATNASSASLAHAASSVHYFTTVPTSANNPLNLKIVVLSSEPATKYDNWLYIITGSN